jgi:hypothetical protein
MADYDRYVHIVIRDGQVRAVISRAKSARESLEYMRSNSMPTYNAGDDLEDYMRRCSEEHNKWRLERWPIVNTMKGL